MFPHIAMLDMLLEDIKKSNQGYKSANMKEYLAQLFMNY